MTWYRTTIKLLVSAIEGLSKEALLPWRLQAKVTGFAAESRLRSSATDGLRCVVAKRGKTTGQIKNQGSYKLSLVDKGLGRGLAAIPYSDSWGFSGAASE